MAVASHLAIGVDAGVYVATARELAGGAVIFRDIGTGYTPLVQMLWAVLHAVFVGGDADVGGFAWGMLALNGAVIFVCALLMYAIARRLQCERALAAFGSAFFLLLHPCLEGAEVVLEPYVNLGLLGALWCALAVRRPLLAAVAAGALCGVAILCKQYGALAAPALLWLVARRDGRTHVAAAVAFCGAAAVVVGGALLCLAWRADMNPFATAAVLSGNAYKTQHEPLTVALALRVLLLWTPAMACVARMLRRGSRLDAHALGLLLLLFGMTLQLYVRQYPHYLQLCAPAASLLLLIALRGAPLRHWLWVAPLVVVCGVLDARVALRVRQDDRAARQATQAAALRAHIPSRSVVTILGDPALYALVDVRASHLPQDGFGFLANFSAAHIAEKMRASDAVVLDVATGGRGAGHARAVQPPEGNLDDMLRDAGFQRDSDAAGLAIWRKDIPAAPSRPSRPSPSSAAPPSTK